MLVSELIREQFGAGYMDDELAVLGKLAGKEIALNAFNNNVDLWMSAWDRQTVTYLLARYLLPIARYLHFTVGIHMLPEYVTQQRFAVAQLDPESGRLLDHAYSMKAYVHRELLDADVEGDDIGEALVIARQIFGEGFYQVLPNQVSYDYVERTMIETYGGAAADFRSLASMARSHGNFHEAIDWLTRGAKAIPECLYFHWELARLHAEQGEIPVAAENFARSLECYHHTGYGVRHEDYYALGRELLEKAPSAFSDTARQDLLLDNGEARMRWLASLFEQGDVAASIKLLSDFRYDTGTDLHPVLFEFLRLHYEELGWEWALAWCGLCAVDESYESRQYRYRGQSLAANWDQPIRGVTGER